MTDTMPTTGTDFAEFFGRMAARNELNANTAGAYGAAVRAVLAGEPDWEQLDVGQLDLDGVLRRFANRAAQSGELKTGSVRAYQRRFKRAREMFLEWANDPAGWKPPSSTPSNKSTTRSVQRPDNRQMLTAGAVRGSGRAVTAQRLALTRGEVECASGHGGLVEYPLPLRGGAIMARLRLPMDLRPDDVARITRFLGGLAVTAADLDLVDGKS